MSQTLNSSRSWKSRLQQLRKHFSPQLVHDFFTRPNDSVDTSNLRVTLERCILVRVIILSLFLVVNGWTEFLSASGQNKFFFIAIALTYAFSLANAYLLRKAENLLVFAYCQLLLDVFLATVASYVSESLTVISLFLLIIVAAAFLIGRHGAVVIAAAAGLAYSIIASALLLPKPEHLANATSGDIIAVYSSLVTIALLSSYVARRLELARLALSQQVQSFSEYHQQQKQLIDGLSEGVITFDLESTITGINEAARAIMGLADLDAGQFVGKPMQEAFPKSAANELVSALSRVSVEREISSELTLQRSDTNRHIQLSYNITTLNDRSGKASGRVLRFADISEYHDIRQQLHMHERMTELLAETQPETIYAKSNGSPREMIGTSGPMQDVFALVDKIAPSDASVLIYGESGTGKELIARSIHFRSLRSSRRFVAVNCGAIPENLLESEFFGHKKGAFTGAIADKPGLFQEAEGGTLFLDEVGELPLHLQTKLLRALQERVIRPVGDTKDIPVNVRVVAATNRELRSEIRSGNFREDLYYRLNVLTIEVPPLRERREDIPLLVTHFMRSLSCGVGKGEDTIIAQISPEALKLLVNYSFPGNIRELENIVSRALVLGGTAILPAHLPEELRSSTHSVRFGHGREQKQRAEKDWAFPLDLDSELADLERKLLIKALESTNGVKTQAASLLGLNFRSFRYRLKKYGLQDETEV